MVDSRRIVIAGASGFLGKRLTYALRMKGYEVALLQRQAEDDSSQDSDSAPAAPPAEADAPTSPTWDPAVGELNEAHLAGADAVICLSGASIAERPWTTEYMHSLRESRLTSVDTLVAAMGRLEAERRPGAFLCASAVGYDGHKADRNPITEEAPRARASWLTCAQTGKHMRTRRTTWGCVPSTCAQAWSWAQMVAC